MIPIKIYIYEHKIIWVSFTFPKYKDIIEIPFPLELLFLDNTINLTISTIRNELYKLN